MMVKTHPPSPLLTNKSLFNHYWLGTTKANWEGVFTFPMVVVVLLTSNNKTIITNNNHNNFIFIF
jgi:hypothetical protein